jgi:serine/threonine-protein kinase
MSASGASFGDYRLLAAIGHGGMAEVFLAVRADQIEFGVDKLIVIKRLREDLASDSEFITMLIDEARLAARLNHPNIVQTNEVGQIDGMYYLSMEYLDGQPLHRILHRMRGAGKSSRALLCAALAEVLAGLDYAHNLEDFAGKPFKIVHRDVTPQNVFITYAGVVKVVDFGIAKATGRSTETREGVIKGKVAYMSPQQALGMGNLDARADVFSVGVMLYEAAIGERMWKGKDELSILRALVKGEIPSSPKEKDPSVPDELDRICRKALAYEPHDRYTAAEMQTDLEAFARSSGVLMSRREIATTVSELFADKRTEVRSVVETRLAQLRGVTSGSIPQISVTDPRASFSGTLPTAATDHRSESRPRPAAAPAPA